MTPTQRTLAECRSRGWLAEVVEKWMPYHGKEDRPGYRKDLFGFGDVVAIDPVANQLLFIQACAGSSVAARHTKITTECRDNLLAVLNAGVKVQVWGWRKLKKPVERKYWQVRIIEVTGT